MTSSPLSYFPLRYDTQPDRYVPPDRTTLGVSLCLTSQGTPPGSRVRTGTPRRTRCTTFVPRLSQGQGRDLYESSSFPPSFPVKKDCSNLVTESNHKPSLGG